MGRPQREVGSSHCGTTGSAVSWERWDVGSIPGLAQWIGDLVLSQLWHRLQPQLGSNPSPRYSICCREATKKKKKKEKKKKNQKTKGRWEDSLAPKGET